MNNNNVNKTVGITLGPLETKQPNNFPQASRAINLNGEIASDDPSKKILGIELNNKPIFPKEFDPNLLESQQIVPSIVAPNVQILPDFFQTNNVNNNNVNFNSGNLVKLKMSSVDSETTNEDELSSPGEGLKFGPKLPKSMDIYLMEKIADGQFSSVWKGRCHKFKTESKESLNKDESSLKNEPEYAVKIFGNHQKAAWQNEKEIYYALSTSNEFILKFFGADIHKIKRNENSNNVQPSFLFSSNEFWLITEFHANGSLNDFLKANFISWSQMVSLAHSFFEGLAYLHSESAETHKKCAIAHRDLKSKNILVKNDGRTCCIGDFGLALKLQSRSKLSNADIRSKVF